MPSPERALCGRQWVGSGRLPYIRCGAALGTLLLLAGPKGVGKSWVAQIAEQELAVHYLDADQLILARLEAGSRPDPEYGWLQPVQEAVLDALAQYRAVSVEITGAWESDYKLARNVEQQGHRVLRLLISAPLEETLARLRTRTSRKVPVSEDEARTTHRQAEDRARRERWDARFDTSGAERPEKAAAVLRRLLEDHS
jgi:shikimate kinase